MVVVFLNTIFIVLKENNRYKSFAQAVLFIKAFEIFYASEFTLQIIFLKDFFTNLERIHQLSLIITILLVSNHLKEAEIFYESLVMFRFLFSLTSLFGNRMKTIVKTLLTSVRMLAEIFVLMAVLMFIFSSIGKKEEK